MCSTENGLEIVLLNQALPEHSEKKEAAELSGLKTESLHIAQEHKSQDFVSMFQEGLRVVNIYQGKEKHPAQRPTGR